MEQYHIIHLEKKSTGISIKLMNVDLIIAKSIALLTGYKLIPKEESTTGNGYKDWFIENYQKPSLTIEVSPYVGPTIVPDENYCAILKKI